MTTGRIDVHSHLVPGVDDGCSTLEESIACARMMVAAGYTHTFVTPHVWPNLPHSTCENVTHWAATLEAQLRLSGIQLKIIPGGELNLTPTLLRTPRDCVHTYGMAGEYALFDFWSDAVPEFFQPTVDWFHSLGIKPILAHPERMRAVQLNPSLADRFAEMGLLLQGNLQCLSDEPNASTRKTIERFLREDRYFLLGSDLHKLDSLPMRLDGLRRAIELVGEAKVDQLTRTNPRKLMCADAWNRH